MRTPMQGHRGRIGRKENELTMSRKPCELHAVTWRPHGFLAMTCSSIRPHGGRMVWHRLYAGVWGPYGVLGGCFLGFLTRVCFIFSMRAHEKPHENQKPSKVIKADPKMLQTASSSFKCLWNALKYN